MQKQYQDTQVVILQQNYRSSGSIINFASEIIEQDVSRPVKRMQPTHLYGPIPTLKTLPNAEAEAAWIVNEIKRIKGITGGLLEFSDFAILLRSAACALRAFRRWCESA